MDRSEQARKGYVAPVKVDAMRKWDNNSIVRGQTILFAQPRSGSTLMMRLQSISSFRNVIGDRDLLFYNSLVNLWASAGVNAIYGKLEELEKDKVFYDTYYGPSEEHSKRMLAYYMKNILFNGPSGFSKVTILGFGNRDLEPFVEMIREMNEVSDYPINIGWLSRPHDEIVTSLQTKEGPGKVSAQQHPDVLLNLLDKQLKQFRSCYELGDAVINYQDILDDPIAAILKMQPNRYPMAKKVNEVMAHKLR